MAKAKSGQLRQVLARNVRLLRHDLGLSQEELAHKAKLHRTYMGMIERAERNLSVDNIEKIAKALEVKPHQLLMDGRKGGSG
jgi:transcriptional regulator with XRE-family HTH domain